MIPWLLVGIGAAGCVMAGVSFLFDYRFGAQFKKAMGSVPGVIQRSAGGWLKIFLVSLAVLAAGLLLMGVCSRRMTVDPGNDELSVELVSPNQRDAVSPAVSESREPLSVNRTP